MTTNNYMSFISELGGAGFNISNYEKIYKYLDRIPDKAWGHLAEHIIKTRTTKFSPNVAAILKSYDEIKHLYVEKTENSNQEMPWVTREKEIKRLAEEAEGMYETTTVLCKAREISRDCYIAVKSYYRSLAWTAAEAVVKSGDDVPESIRGEYSYDGYGVSREAARATAKASIEVGQVVIKPCLDKLQEIKAFHIRKTEEDEVRRAAEKGGARFIDNKTLRKAAEKATNRMEVA